MYKYNNTLIPDHSLIWLPPEACETEIMKDMQQCSAWYMGTWEGSILIKLIPKMVKIQTLNVKQIFSLKSTLSFLWSGFQGQLQYTS